MLWDHLADFRFEKFRQFNKMFAFSYIPSIALTVAVKWLLICVVWFAALYKKWRIYWVAQNSTRQLQEMQRKGRQIYLWRLNGYVCGTDRLEADHSHLWNENLQSPDRAERFSGAPQWSVLTENVRGLPPQEGADKNQPGCASTVLWEPPQLHYHQDSSAYRTDPGNKPAPTPPPALHQRAALR